MIKSLKRLACLFLAGIVLAGSFPVTNYAAENSEDYFLLDEYAGRSTEHDVLVNGEYRVIYCMQATKPWPVINRPGYMNEPTQFVEATGEDMLHLDEKQQETVLKVLFAGYPYNGKGYFEEIYENYSAWGEFGKTMADDVASSITAAVIWGLMSKWRVPGNYDYSGTIEGPIWYTSEGEEASSQSIVDAILDYAEGDDLLTPPESSEVSLSGSGTMTEIDGVWKTGELSITDPDGCSCTYNLVVPEGITVTDEEGNAITSIEGGETFFVSAESKDKITEDTKIEVDTTVLYPSNVVQYKPLNEERVQNTETQQSEMKLPQIMLSANVAEKPLAGSLLLSIEEEDEDDENTGEVDGDGSNEEGDNQSGGGNNSGDNSGNNSGSGDGQNDGGNNSEDTGNQGGSTAPSGSHSGGNNGGNHSQSGNNTEIEQKTDSTTVVSKGVKTGDTTPFAAMVTISILSAIALLVLPIFRKKF